MDITETEKKVREIIETFLTQREIELVEFSLRYRPGGLNLTLLIDKPNGIIINECAAINRELGLLLDDGALINEQYVLEVSSPGLDRPLKSDVDFKRVMGKIIKVTTSQNIQGLNVIIGVLREYNSDIITVVLKDDREIVIPRQLIAKTVLEIKF
ncbi:MAG: hypothetical protein V1893_02960 [Candidatus Omnitrophota bacterium]